MYDAENKQISVSDSNGTICQYSYDGDGKRVKKFVPSSGELTVFVYDAAGKEIAEYSTIVSAVQDAKVNYLTADHLGSPRINTDQNGAIITRHDYMPFGEEIDGTGGRTTGLNYGDDTVRKQFTAYERDNESDLDFAQARYFDFGFGRFSSPDPLEASAIAAQPQSWNRYSYSYNNPIHFTDPSGMLAGDFLENKTGKYLGTDGQKDGIYYAVTDEKEAKLIAANDKKGGTTALSSVASAIDITSGSYDVRQALGAAVVRSNNPSGSDTMGGFHEEAVTWGPDANGVVRAIDAAPGPVSDPLKDSHAQVTASNFANKADENVLQDFGGSGHVHPSGVKTENTSAPTRPGETRIGNERTSRGEFVQKPSQVDINGAIPGKTYVVMGAGDNTTYFYRSAGNNLKCNCVARIPTKVFLGLK